VSSREERELRYEAKREAAPALALALAVLVVLALVSWAEGWELLHSVRWWIWLVTAVPEAVLLVDLLLGSSLARTRRLALTLLGVLVLGNLASLAILLAGLLTTSTRDLGGGELLLTGAAIWVTNFIVFGFWFWEIDAGGPVARAMHERSTPDFQFPQDENPELAQEEWAPRLWDYFYVSLTNSIAFSPTDVMPLTRPAKTLMAAESTLSAITVLLVAARAVNILS
jgi:hypothetical protein